MLLLFPVEWWGGWAAGDGGPGMAFVHPEKDVGQWLIPGLLVGSGVTGPGPCLVCDLGTMTGMMARYPVYLPKPGTYHNVAEWAEGTWTGHWVNPSHLYLPTLRRTPRPGLVWAGSLPGGSL